MKLKSNIDRTIQIELLSNEIEFPTDRKGRILIQEFRIDTKARAGMLYLLPESKLPQGALPFLVAPAEYVYCVFHVQRKAAIVEVSSMALEGEMEDWYVKNLN